MLIDSIPFRVWVFYAMSIQIMVTALPKVTWRLKTLTDRRRPDRALCVTNSPIDLYRLAFMQSSDLDSSIIHLQNPS